MDELQKQQQENQGLLQAQRGMGDELSNARAQYEEMAEFARALRERVEEKCQEVEQMRGLMAQYQSEWVRKAQTEQDLSEQIDRLQPILAENADMKDELIQLGGELTDREAELRSKQNELDDLVGEIQESEHSRRQLEGVLKQTQDQMREDERQFAEHKRGLEQ